MYATISAIFSINIDIFFSLPMCVSLSKPFKITGAGTAQILFFTNVCVWEHATPVIVNNINSNNTFIF